MLALETFEEMMLWQKDNIDGITKHAEVASSMGNIQKSLFSYERVIQLGEDSVNIRIGLGSLFYNDGNHRKALHHFQIAWEIYMSAKGTKDDGEYNESYILHRLGRCHKEMSETDKAKDSLEQALKLNPASKEIMMDLAAVLMANGKHGIHGIVYHTLGFYICLYLSICLFLYCFTH